MPTFARIVVDMIRHVTSHRASIRPSRSLSILAGLIFVLSSVSGCSGNSEKLIPVSGTVSIEGKALSTGTVTLVPEAESGEKSFQRPLGAIKSDGHFELFTNGKKGVSPGKYKVVVFAASQTDLKTGQP